MLKNFAAEPHLEKENKALFGVDRSELEPKSQEQPQA